MTTLPEELVVPLTISGRGAIGRLVKVCAEFGPRGLLIHGGALRRNGVLDRIKGMAEGVVSVVCLEHRGREPLVSDVENVLTVARSCDACWVAATGGGSVLDLGKAVAGLFNASGAPAAYHDGQALERVGVPFIASPTTAGTGSEATTVAVLTNEKNGLKKSIRHPSFMPRVAVLDPDLLLGCPPNVVAASGMDALVQAIESYCSRYATWFSDALALRAVSLVSRSVVNVFENPGCPDAEDLMMGSYLAGVALSHARLGVVHGLAHPLGAYYGVPHGIVCAVCLPHALAFNRKAMGWKYEAISAAMEGDAEEKIRFLLERLAISPRLFAGKALVNRERIVEETLASGSTAANPAPVAKGDVEFLLSRLFGES